MTEIGASTPELAIPIPGEASGEIRIAWAAVTDVGRRRAANEDSFIAAPPVFAIADGMGGHLAGDLASAAVVTRLAEARTSDFIAPETIEPALERASADIDVISDGSEIGVGTTVTGAVLTLVDGDPYFAVFNIGDSRVYRFERNELAQITVDHSLVQQLVDSGAISQAQAHNHPDGNVITRAVGFQSQPTPDFWLLPLRAGLRLLVCSDGLTGEVEDERIRLHLAAGLSADETAGALVDAALAEGGRDNITVLIVDVVAAPEPSEPGTTAPRATHRAL
ncbi:protein phosphatase 2C domain-containing protein [Conyzicola nivalis]|uniref:Serine/threonine protein phosphatase n=1 Tax=Conyzicola nivalis TaxID=1477021 RepID=A0A916WFC9_9MICO|nr:protein phosphatase 2C domain-containing protein [Conyzicola nivalis]GGA92414.1 serine/threonine protein phosphatase [Conyzicola nivalis]